MANSSWTGQAAKPSGNELDENHYKEVLSLVEKAKRTVWIGTADIKDLYVYDKPFLAMLANLLKKGIEVRLIHAKEPGTAWREEHEKHPILYDGMERVLCPRVHFKLIVIDCSIAYIGSANLTSAGMGMKSPRKRNFFVKPNEQSKLVYTLPWREKEG